MTVRDWLKDYEWFPQVEHNAAMQEVGWTLDSEVIDAKEALLGAFVWDDSPEGHDFWSNIHKKLEQ